MEISTPIPSVFPSEAIVALDVKNPITKPEAAIIVPEVIMVGKASLRVRDIALFFLSHSSLSTMYLPVITIA